MILLAICNVMTLSKSGTRTLFWGSLRRTENDVTDMACRLRAWTIWSKGANGFIL